MRLFDEGGYSATMRPQRVAVRTIVAAQKTFRGVVAAPAISSDVIKIGLVVAFNGRPQRTMADLKSVAVHAETAGFDSLWFPEHVVFFPTYTSKYPCTEEGHPGFGKRAGVYDPLFAATVAARATERVRVGTAVLIAEPKPIQSPLPIWVGGGSVSMRRAARYGTGWYGWNLHGDAIAAAMHELDQVCEAEGRDQSTMRRKVGLPFDGSARDLHRYLDAAAKAGVSEVVVAIGTHAPRIHERIDALAVTER